MTDRTSRSLQSHSPRSFSRIHSSLLALAVASITLAGCGGDKQSVSATDRNPGELYFSYPAADQAAVPVTAPVYMRFTRALAMDESDLDPDMLQLTSDQGEVVNLTDFTMTSGDRGIAARPSEPLKPGTRYTLVNQGLATSAGDIALPDGGISFTTAPATHGPLLDRTEGNGFRVARFIPTGDDIYPATDMSVLRVQFTEPVDESSLQYGETISLLDGNGETVAAQMHVQGHRVTVDPEEDLDPAQTYTVNLTDDIRSTIADAPLELPPEAPWTFRPLDSTSPNGERERMAQTATTNTGNLALSNEAYNSVKLSSLLLGNNNATTATGTVFAELGFIPRFDKAGQSVPLRIDRGALMTGSDVAVNVAGELPAGFSSEAIQVRFLSDANGFLMSNPNTDDENAPRLVELYIDMALNTGNTIANAALGQELLHVHLVGTALVEDGTLTIEAVGVIEPDVMGVDVASGLISFRLEGYRNPADAPPEASFTDNEAPSIKSWVPGKDHQDKMRPGDPVIVYFSEPVLPGSVTQETVTLYKDGSEQDMSFSLNGSALVIKPSVPLEHGADYSLLLNGITDLAGHELAAPQLNFALAETGHGVPVNAGPIALTTNPGYPCAKTDLDVQAGKQGRCLGGITQTTPDSTNFGERPLDDLLPITQHPANRPLVVRFSQNINPNSVFSDSANPEHGTVQVQKSTDDGQTWTYVDDFHIAINLREIQIIPLSDWERGSMYRYILTSGITNTEGVPLYTKLLSQYRDPGRPITDLVAGGFNLENRFVAAAPQNRVVPIALGNLPSADANSDLTLNVPSEVPESFSETPDNSAQLGISGVASDVVGSGRIGCSVDTTTCETYREFIYKTAALDVEVGSESVTTADGVKIPVKLNPSVLLTTSSDVWIKFSNQFLADLATETGDANQVVPTGPMVMRMRYQGSDERTEKIDGFILIKNGELTFQTELDVYLDAPYLNARLSGLANTRLEDNMRSYPINNLKLEGPVTFLEDGRMQIEQTNASDSIELDVTLLGEATVSFLEDCGIFQFFCDAVNSITNVIIDVDTDLAMTIPARGLKLNYISPYTQN
ncbi:MAG: Ig-like domain-containing protein [Pseudomonadota bacterium]